MDVFDETASWALAHDLKLWKSLETTSTNSVAKDDTDPLIRPSLPTPADADAATSTVSGAVSGPISSPTLYLAKRQNGGRGRGTHTWSTPDGSALLSSWSYALGRVPQPIFSALAGLALFESARAAWPNLEFNVKAPNDLFIGDKKTAGILIETVDQGALKTTIVGLGLNVEAPPSDVPTSTSLRDRLGRSVTREEWHGFLDRWYKELGSALVAGQNERLLQDTCERLRAALNRHPLLKEPILKVDDRGQLFSASRTIYWHEL